MMPGTGNQWMIDGDNVATRNTYDRRGSATPLREQVLAPVTDIVVSAATTFSDYQRHVSDRC